MARIGKSGTEWSKIVRTAFIGAELAQIGQNLHAVTHSWLSLTSIGKDLTQIGQNWFSMVRTVL